MSRLMVYIGLEIFWKPVGQFSRYEALKGVEKGYWEKLLITIRKIDTKQDIFPLETEDLTKSITRGSSIDIEKE